MHSSPLQRSSRAQRNRCTLTACAPLVLASVISALTAASPAFAARAIRVRIPPFVVPPHSDREVCSFVPVPADAPFNFQRSVVVNVGGNRHLTTHHFLAWFYRGQDVDAFPPRGQIADNTGCIEFGPTDTNERTVITLAQAPKVRTSLGDGLAQRLEPAVTRSGSKVLGIILNSHWINSGDRPRRASARLTMVAAKRHTVRRFVQPIFDITANGRLFVKPFDANDPTAGAASVHAYWGPGAVHLSTGLSGGSVPPATTTACVVSVTSHMHKRGVLFAIDLVKGPVNPLGFGPQTEQVLLPDILRTTQYTDPPLVPLMKDGAGMPVHPGEYLRYTCTHENGEGTVPVKMGCEETAGMAPGDAVATLLSRHLSLDEASRQAAARRCTSDVDCAGFGTERCVPANLVFGFTSDDDMCIMPGGYYDADANGNCDVMSFPVDPNG